MKYRVFAVLVLSVLVLNLAGSTLADSKSKKANVSQLVALLPASDGVVTLDVRRFFGDALPRLLSSNQAMLAKVTSKIEAFQSKTGVDIRQFDEVAIGVASRQIAAKKYDVDPVVIGRGQINSATLIDAAKRSADGKFREEQVGGRVIYIFDAEKVAAQAVPNQKVVGKISEVGVAALDDRTIAFGDLARVRMTLEGKTRVSPDLIVMLEKNPAAVSAFAAKPPAGMKAFVPMENDELGKNIDSIQYIYGHADVSGDLATVQMTARTSQNAQAKSLHETLEGLQVIGKAILGGAKGADKQVYRRLVESARFSVRANEVMFDLQVPQSDIDILVGMLK